MQFNRVNKERLHFPWQWCRHMHVSEFHVTGGSEGLMAGLPGFDKEIVFI